ncbi:MAG: hypothetical protein ACK4SY_07020 [Pyrobaculum sp.]
MIPEPLMSIGRRVVHFAVLYSLMFAILNTAFVGALGRPLGSVEPLNIPTANITVTTDPTWWLQAAHFGSMMYSFVISMVSALPSLVNFFKPAMDAIAPWLYPPAMSAAVVLQAIAMAYMFYEVAKFVRGLFNPYQQW